MMRKAIILSAAAILAAITFSSMARAESAAWYNIFQVEACKRMPHQAGCYGFWDAPPAAPEVYAPVRKRGHR